MPFRIVVQKTLRAILTVLLLVTAVFIVLRLSGDPASALLGAETEQDVLEALRQKLGVNRSIPEQYIAFLGEIAQGHFGRSYLDRRDALETVMERVPRTLLLMGVTMVVALAIGIPAGIAAALSQGRWLDRGIMMLAVAGFCLPGFVIAILLILLLSVTWGLLPTTGYGTAKHLVLPVITMATHETAVFARYTRSAMLQVLSQPYMRTALAKGLPWPRAVRRHALPNTAIPLVTIGGFFVGSMIAGAVITESIFAWPGVGRLFVTSVALRDLPVVQVIIMLAGISMVVTNLTVDLLYGWLDPRIGALLAKRMKGTDR
ncbi:MAG: ABC transporter permease [Alphaproteobacteria bacterium]|nr:ABC transporter permease [Alphaproteobacteria bacterium]